MHQPYLIFIPNLMNVMAHKQFLEPVGGLLRSTATRVPRVRVSRAALPDQRYTNLHQQCRPTHIRCLSTESILPSQTIEQSYANAHLSSTNTKSILEDTFSQAPPTPPTQSARTPHRPPPNPFLTTATCTLHSFPSLEPTGTHSYPSTHLLLPLRRDILHRAVIYEGDKTRQGTASTKWRDEVHGSNKKIRPQKGTGSARLGDKKSPMLKGGGVAFGPKPRDFSTDLPRKIYDLAWRTALSHRYRQGELLPLEGEAEIERTGPGSARWVKEMLSWHVRGRDRRRNLFVTLEKRENLYSAMRDMEPRARALTVEEVDVKDLLESGNLIIEKLALNAIFKAHRSDLGLKRHDDAGL